MNGANIFASIVIGFCGGSRGLHRTVIEIPNFTQEEPPPQRLVFMPKRSTVKHIMSYSRRGWSYTIPCP